MPDKIHCPDPQEPKIIPAAVFQVAVDITMNHEGGYVDDPNDPGGETHFGISKRSYPQLDIKHLTREKAKDTYCTDFWKKPQLDLLAYVAPDLAIKIFDLGVNCGPTTAIIFLQRAINTVCIGRQVVVDGIIGPVTLDVIKDCPHEDALMAALKGEAYKYYTERDPRYIAGWLNRLES